MINGNWDIPWRFPHVGIRCRYTWISYAFFVWGMCHAYHPAQGKLPQNPPVFFDLNDEWQKASESEFVFEFSNPDTLLQHSMYLLKDPAGQALVFYADVLTPVCIDGLCKPVYIELYWNLIGEYVGYGVFPGKALTKFDHEVFEPQDYQKLHDLLGNPHSILDRKEMSDLYDVKGKAEKKISYKGVEVDAVSGATKKEIKESIVEGALYSCYTLWHLIYGDAANKIQAYVANHYTQTLASYFIDSDYEAYQYYALKRLEAADFVNNFVRILNICQNAKPLIRTYVLKKMPKDLYTRDLFTERFYGKFSEFDISTKSLLIKNLPYSNENASLLLSQHISAMSKNLLKSYLLHLEENPSFQTEEVLANMTYIAETGKYEYGYLLSGFLGEE